MLDSESIEDKRFSPSPTLGEKLTLDIQPEKPMIAKLTASNPEDLNLVAEVLNQNFIVVDTSKILSSDKYDLENKEYFVYLHFLPMRRRNKQ